MSTFIINSELKINFNTTTFKKPLQNKPTDVIVSDFFNDTTRDRSRLYEKRHIDRYRDIPRTNSRKNVRLSLDTQAIRQNKYNFASGRFDSGYPLRNNYPLCIQKVSTVFQNGGSHFTTSIISEPQSYPIEHNFAEVSDIIQLSTVDCGCYYVDFSGDYVLDWSQENGGQLLSSSNSQVNIGTFSFYQSENYFEIFLYPKTLLNNSSYIHIRYRIPIRYRYVYGDWTFWESVLLENSLSETEFIKVVNCCTNDTESLQPL